MIEEYLNLVNKEDCCGCNACVNICPRNCISFKLDEHGSYYPYKNKENCIDCGACEIVCPILHNNSFKLNNKIYACKNKDDEIRKISSSGGIFSAIAKYVIGHNGYVVGAAFSNDYYNVHHVIIDNEEDLALLRGAKYIHSNIESTFKEIKKLLVSNIIVLFSGTPCQIAGLKSFLHHQEYINLICVDVVCHGVPRTGVYQWYIKTLEKKYNSKVIFVTFRDKKNGWRNSSVVFKFENGKDLSMPSTDNSYMRGYINNLYIRLSCTKCKFKNFQSGSDFTLSDFWGSSELRKYKKDNIGVSVVSVNTEKGAKIFNIIKDQLNDVSLIDKGVAYVFNENVSNSAKISSRSQEFLANYRTEDFDRLINQYVPNQPIEIKSSQSFVYTIKRFIYLLFH